MKFREVKQGYHKDEVEEYLNLVATEYENIYKDLKMAKREIRNLKKDRKKLRAENKALSTKENTTSQEIIVATMKGADASGKWIIEEAKKEVAALKEEAHWEVRAIQMKKKKTLSDVRMLVKKLQGIVKETQQKQAVNENKTQRHKT
jgi:DivIVA domain